MPTEPSDEMTAQAIVMLRGLAATRARSDKYRVREKNRSRRRETSMHLLLGRTSESNGFITRRVVGRWLVRFGHEQSIYSKTSQLFP